MPRLGLRTKPAPNAAGGLHAAGTAHSAHTSCRHATERHPSLGDATTSARWLGKRDRMWRLAAAAIALAAQQHQSPTTDHPHDRSTATDLFVFVSLSFFMVFVDVSFVVLRTLVLILPIDSAPTQCRATGNVGGAPLMSGLSTAESRMSTMGPTHNSSVPGTERDGGRAPSTADEPIRTATDLCVFGVLIAVVQILRIDKTRKQCCANRKRWGWPVLRGLSAAESTRTQRTTPPPARVPDTMRYAPTPTTQRFATAAD